MPETIVLYIHYEIYINFKCPLLPRKLFALSLSLSQSLLDSVSLLLPENHDLEPLEVSQSSSSLTLGNLLSPGVGSPLGADLSGSPLLLDNSSSGTSWQSKGYWSQNNLTQVDILARNTSNWTINQNL